MLLLVPRHVHIGRAKAHTFQVVLEVVAQAIGMLFVHVCDDTLLDSIIGGSHIRGLCGNRICECAMYGRVKGG